jgi:flavin-dependent dehydrogenase
VGIGVVLSDVKKRNVDLKQAMFKVLKENKLFRERFKDAVLTSEVKGWTLPFASYKRKIAGDSWILLGDAASLVDPFSGEGMGNGSLSARIAAPVILEALKKGDSTVLQQYPEKLWQNLDPEVSMSYKMQKLGRWKFLLNLVIGKIKKSE